MVVQPCESTTRLDEPHESHSGTTRLRLRWRTRRLASLALAFGKATRRSPRRRAMIRPRRPAWKCIFKSRRHSMFRAARLTTRRKILFPDGSGARTMILADLRRARPGDIRSNNTSRQSRFTSLGICTICAILYSAGPAARDGWESDCGRAEGVRVLRRLLDEFAETKEAGVTGRGCPRTSGWLRLSSARSFVGCAPPPIGSGLCLVIGLGSEWCK